jgi:hypothetical protein
LTELSASYPIFELDKQKIFERVLVAVVPTTKILLLCTATSSSHPASTRSKNFSFSCLNLLYNLIGLKLSVIFAYMAFPFP